MHRRETAHLPCISIFIASVLCLGEPSEAQAPFTEEGLLRGINYVTMDQFPNASHGKGLAFADLDGDGDADLVALGSSNGVVGIFANDGNGFFEDRSLTSAIPSVGNASAVTAADYDGDGDLDLYLANYWQPNLLLRNEGGLVFSNVTATAGVGDPGAGVGCAWGDYDSDGWLDLYVANYLDGGGQAPNENRLYHNLGDGTFEEVSSALGVQDQGAPTFQPIFFDFDWDADADLYLSTDKGYFGMGWQNHLFENMGGTFVEISAASGTGAEINSMGVAVGDLDGNGFQDLYCTNTTEGNPLYLNQGDGTFLESSAQAGVQSSGVGWGTLFFDYDNNSWLELYVCNAGAANGLFVCNGTWPCVDVAAMLGVADQAPSFALAAADIDNDGDLELAVQNRNDRVRLYVNQEGQSRNWAKFRVIGQAPNHFAIGAHLALRIGSMWQHREIFGGGNYKSQNELTVHFGLEAAELVDELVVTWPGGTSRTLAGLAANRTCFVVPPEALGDMDGDGLIGVDDVGPFVEALLAEDENPVVSAHADFNGNGFPDGGDIQPFLVALVP